MKIFDIALKDLTQILRDWKAAFFLLVMPIAFTLLFGFIFDTSSDPDADTRLPAGYLDLDQGQLSPYLFELLDSSEVIRLEAQKMGADFDKLVKNEDLAMVVVVPAGYSAAALAGEAARLRVIVDAETDSGFTAESEVQSAASRLFDALRNAQISAQAYESQQAFPSQEARQAYLNAGVERTLAAWQDAPVKVEVKQAVLTQEDEAQVANPYAHSSPGMMAQFAIAGLIGAAEVLVLERKTRALQRLLTTSVSRVHILAGHFLAIFTMIFLQFLILTIFGQIFLRLGYYDQPLATLLMIIATALFSGGLGLLIGTLAKNEEQVIVLTLIPMFVLAGLGGAWVPLEFTPKTIQLIGHFTPVAWIMDGFKAILLRGAGLQETLLPAGVLLAFTAGCLGLSAWRFKFE